MKKLFGTVILLASFGCGPDWGDCKDCTGQTAVSVDGTSQVPVAGNVTVVVVVNDSQVQNQSQQQDQTQSTPPALPPPPAPPPVTPPKTCTKVCTKMAKAWKCDGKYYASCRHSKCKQVNKCLCEETRCN